MLQESNRFSIIEILSGDVTKETFNDKMRSIESRLNGKTTNEFLVYFSGHGIRNIEGELYYPCNNYSDHKSQQTSIVDSELDDFARSLRPKIYTKFVDACYSGQPKIKDKRPQPFSGPNELNTVYVFASSGYAQRSYANGEISDFTRAIVELIADRSGKIIYYNDISPYLRDNFTSQLQDPFIINHGSCRSHEFLVVTESIAQKASNYCPNIESRSPPNSSASPDQQLGAAVSAAPEVATKVILSADNYSSFAGEISAKLQLMSHLHRDVNFISSHFESMQKYIDNWTKTEAAIHSGLYEFEIKYTKHPRQEDGAILLAEYMEGDTEKDYFAEISSREETYEISEEEERQSMGLLGLGSSYYSLIKSFDPNRRKRTRRVITGYRPTLNIPFSQLVITAKRRVFSISNIRLITHFAVSRTHLAYVSSTEQMKEQAPDCYVSKRILDFHDPKSIPWSTEENDFIVKSPICNFLSFVTDHILESVKHTTTIKP